MDSKYNLIENGHSSSSVNGFSIKRKFYNGTGNHNAPNKKQQCDNQIHFGTTNGNNVSNNNNHGNIPRQPILSIQDQRRNLPVFHAKKGLIQAIIKRTTIIIIGETGSGKTTQIPQFLHDAGFTEKGMIAITQPRRVAAITISKRVCQEQDCKLGDLVGYTVRFEDMTTKTTKIRFMTDGSLLREALSDRLLKNYSVIVLDEAHERTINTDVLFGIVKEAQRIRFEKHMNPLKILIMSATMDVDHFSKYFNDCEVIYLMGRTYPVKVMHAKVQQSDYTHACMSTLFEIHRTAPANHDVLIFLTGQDEIEHMTIQIRAIAKSNDIKGPQIRVQPLYSQMPQSKQLEVFQPSAAGTRKVVLSTNIAETSLTIKGIKYVIDCGFVKRRVYDSVTGMDTLKVVKISQDQAWQRTGRAGRDSAGCCYRTYTMAEYTAMSDSAMPEILRSNIASTVLQLLALGINCQKFDFLDKPSPGSIENALNQLHGLGALKTIDGEALTQFGRDMAKFPLDPRFSKILLTAPAYDCLEEMLSIVAVLSGESVFFQVHDQDKKVDALTAHAKFESIYGDHLTLLNVYRAFQSAERAKMWCHENYLNSRNLIYAREVRNQLSEICERLELPKASCHGDVDQVRKCLITGLFMNVAELQRDNHYITLAANRQKAKIHPSSVLSNKPHSRCVLFTELVYTGKSYMRMVTTVEPEWMEKIVPNCGFLKRFSNFNWT